MSHVCGWCRRAFDSSAKLASHRSRTQNSCPLVSSLPGRGRAAAVAAAAQLPLPDDADFDDLAPDAGHQAEQQEGPEQQGEQHQQQEEGADQQHQEQQRHHHHHHHHQQQQQQQQQQGGGPGAPLSTSGAGHAQQAEPERLQGQSLLEEFAALLVEDMQKAACARLLKIIHLAQGDLRDVTSAFPGIDSMLAWVDARRMEGFVCTDLSADGDGQQVFWHRDPMKQLPGLFARMAPGFVLEPRQLQRDGVRVWVSLHTGDWWLEEQRDAGFGCIVVPLIFYSDSTHCTQDGTIHLRPIVMTLGCNTPEAQHQRSGQHAQPFLHGQQQRPPQQGETAKM